MASCPKHSAQAARSCRPKQHLCCKPSTALTGQQALRWRHSRQMCAALCCGALRAIQATGPRLAERRCNTRSCLLQPSRCRRQQSMLTVTGSWPTRSCLWIATGSMMMRRTAAGVRVQTTVRGTATVTAPSAVSRSQAHQQLPSIAAALLLRRSALSAAPSAAVVAAIVRVVHAAVAPQASVLLQLVCSLLWQMPQTAALQPQQRCI